jgi:predicted nucleotidyltransferase
MRLKNIRDDYILKTPSKFFEEVEKYSDLDIKLAFLMYNKYLKRFNLAGVLENTLEEKVNRKRHLKLFGRGLN